ncbi:MAG: hypothetical protein KJ787_14515 [Gammaproteobacteria bacterium]|nr:hypothetical protein [Gammaproteobacteria bacterium]MBU1647543.1 hypothetical protein [Gammaproteobacteria bacterium]MBU1972992.1 hypothetical protein [Gammaproteobacteria bacterium]
MTQPLAALIVLLWISSVFAADADSPAAPPPEAPAAAAAIADAKRIERDLQALEWTQFRTVIESIPGMKADVDAYGLLGWSYVQANYRTYAWRKNIDRLDEAQRAQLVELIRVAKGVGDAPNAKAAGAPADAPAESRTDL